MLNSSTSIKSNYLRLYHPLKKKVKVLWIWSHYPRYVKGLAGCRCLRRPYLQTFIGRKKLNFDQIALVMKSADKKVHDIVACSYTTTFTHPNISHINRGNSSWGKSEKPCFDMMISSHQIIATSGMQLATSAWKLATFQQPAWKGKVLRAPEIAEHIRSTEMSMMTAHSITSGDTASVH